MFYEQHSALCGEYTLVFLTRIAVLAFWDMLELVLVVTEDYVILQLPLLVKLLITSAFNDIDIQQQTFGLFNILPNSFFMNNLVKHSQMFDEIGS